MKKHVVVLTLSALCMWALFAVFAGAQEPIVIRYMSNTDDLPGVNDEIKAVFEAQNPGITIEYVAMPQGGAADQVHDKYVTMLAAGDGSIDVFSSDVIWPPELAAAGWLLPLDEWFSKEEQAKYIPAMIDAQTINGHIYGVPWMTDFGALYYRKDLLEEAGLEPPKTWQEMVEIAQKFHNPPDMFGYVSNFKADQQLMCEYVEFLHSNGGRFLDESGTKILFTEPESVEAIQFMSDMVNTYKIVQPGITTMGVDEGRTIFTEGRAVFHRNWLYVWALAEHHEASKVKGKVGVMLLPTFKEGMNTSTLGGWSFSVNAFTEHKEEAVKAALFLGGPEAQKIRALKSNRVPPYLPVLNDPDVVAKNPVYLEMAKFANNIKSRPKTPFYTQISDIFQAELQEAILMRKTPEEAVNDAAEEIEPLLE